MSVEPTPDRRFCVAPMLDWTTRHQRYFMRLISQQALLYTEMVTTGALIHGDRERYLAFNAEEHPLALQLGGSEPADMAYCARLAQEYGYDEVNINVGCPSERVQKGAFGACLMLEPELVAECVGEMQVAAPHIPVTVKHRIGVDEQDAYEQLARFVDTVASAGCKTFIAHARKAWLKGLSPKENREVPPLSYDTIYRLKQDFPALEVIINGGITTLDAALLHLQQVDGVMVGREAYHNPYHWSQVDRLIYGASMPVASRHQVLDRFIEYTRQQLAQGIALNHMTRHILGLFHGQPGARLWRRHLSENAPKKGAGIEVLMQAKEIQLEQQKAFDLKNAKL